MNSVTYYTDVLNACYPIYFKTKGIEEHCNFTNCPEIHLFHFLPSGRIFNYVRPADSSSSNYTF